jgi:hypothetical protein
MPACRTILCCLPCLLCLPASAAIITVSNNSASSLRSAVQNARAGDTVIVTGTYNLGTTGLSTNANGTAASRIILIGGPTGATLIGGTSGNGIAITHNYWSVSNLTITGFQKSFRIDSADHGLIDNVSMSNSTGEAVKLRNTSRYWLIQNCRVANAGAEGYYAGDADQNWQGGTPDATSHITFYNCKAFQTGNDGFDFKEGTHTIKVINCSADWNYTTPGVLDRGNSGVYNRADKLQVINFSARNNASTGDVIRADRTLALDGQTYGFNAEYFNITGQNMAGSLLSSDHTDSILYDNYSFTSLAAGLLEPGSIPPAIALPSSFVESQWNGPSGQPFLAVSIPEPSAATLLLSLAAVSTRRSRNH